MINRLNKVIRDFIDTKRAGTGSKTDLAHRLHSVERSAKTVLAICLSVIVLLFIVSFYLAVRSEDAAMISNIIAADGVIFAGIVEMMRRSYRDMMGSQYILAMIEVVDDSQIVDILRSFTEKHLG